MLEMIFDLRLHGAFKRKSFVFRDALLLMRYKCYRKQMRREEAGMKHNRALRYK